MRATTSADNPRRRPVADSAPDPHQRGGLLRAAMVENGLFSGLSGLAVAVGSPALDVWLGVNQWLLLGVGIGLLSYAALLLVASRRAGLLRPVGQLSVAGDLLWVAGAAGLISLGDVLTGRGNLTLALVTAVVLALAAMQWLGLRRLTPKSPHHSPPR